MDNSPTLLVDGDVVAFLAAAACQHTVMSENGFTEPFAVAAEAEAATDNLLFRLKERLKGDRMVVFLSCPSEENWRLKVSDTYKSNRKNSVRPMLLTHLKNYLRSKYGAFHMPSLEADDAIGIWATHPTLVVGRKVIVGRDKDFATIPGEHYQFKDDDAAGKPVVRTVTEAEAQRFHYAQALAGDRVDGYEGCPGVGMTRAVRIVEEPEKLVPKEGTITRGARKGEKVIKWHSAGPCSVWEAVVSNYEKAGLGEAEALVTARLAKILLAPDYNIDTHTVTLWVPGDD